MYKFFSTISFIFIFFLLNFFSYLFANIKIDQISAIVGNEIILESEIEEKIIQEKIKNNKIQKEDILKNRCNIFKEMINNQILLYYGKKNNNIKIYNKEIEQEVEEIIKNFDKNFENEKDLLKAYGRNNMIDLYKEITKIVKNREYIRLQYEDIIKNINPTHKEIKHFYKKNKNKFSKIPEQFKISKIIFFPYISKIHKKNIFDKLKKIKKDILNGENFSIKAILNSEDLESSYNGGLIRNIKRKQVVKKIEKIAFSMKEGEISDPFETKFGFHIIKLEKRKGQKLDIRNILIKPKYTDEEINNAKNLADLVYKLLLENKISFEEAIKKYCNKKLEKINNIFLEENFFLEKNQLPFDITNYLLDLGEKKISKPHEEEFNGNKCFIILKIKKHIPEHSISFLNDYQIIKFIVKNFKKVKKLNNWIDNHKKNIFIKVEKKYKNCLL